MNRVSGDGNLHLNVTTPEFDPAVLKIIEPFVFEWTSKLKGSVSAEHGIGFKKTQYIHFSKSESSLNLMVNIKKLMDPKGILNPYKVLPAQHWGPDVVSCCAVYQDLASVDVTSHRILHLKYILYLFHHYYVIHMICKTLASSVYMTEKRRFVGHQVMSLFIYMKFVSWKSL